MANESVECMACRSIHPVPRDDAHRRALGCLGYFPDPKSCAFVGCERKADDAAGLIGTCKPCADAILRDHPESVSAETKRLIDSADRVLASLTKDGGKMSEALKAQYDLIAGGICGVECPAKCFEHATPRSGVPALIHNDHAIPRDAFKRMEAMLAERVEKSSRAAGKPLLLGYVEAAKAEMKNAFAGAVERAAAGVGLRAPSGSGERALFDAFTSKPAVPPSISPDHFERIAAALPAPAVVCEASGCGALLQDPEDCAIAASHPARRWRVCKPCMARYESGEGLSIFYGRNDFERDREAPIGALVGVPRASDGARLMWTKERGNHGDTVRRDVSAGMSLIWMADEAIASCEEIAERRAEIAAIERENASLKRSLASARQCIEEVREAHSIIACNVCEASRCAACKVRRYPANAARSHALTLIEALAKHRLPMPSEVRYLRSDPHPEIIPLDGIHLGWDAMGVWIPLDGQIEMLRNDVKAVMLRGGWLKDVLGAVAALGTTKSSQSSSRLVDAPHEARGPACAMTQRPERAK